MSHNGCVRSFVHPSPSEVTIDQVLTALADPMRRSIVRQLTGEHPVLACSAFDLPIGSSTRTHHFRVLREAGVIMQRYEGNAILNSLRVDVMDSRFPGLLAAITSAGEKPANLD